MKTYLVTGGAGFIGSHLCDNLIELGNKVIVIDNFNDYYDPQIKERNIYHHSKDENHIVYRIDIRDKKALDEVFNNNYVDTVIHLAAMAGVRPSIEDPLLYQEVNCMGSQNLLEVMRKYSVKKMVFASSSSVYGNNKVVPFNEKHNVDFAISPYAATKKANEVMGHVYHSLFGLDVAFLRFFTVYGPRQRPDLAIHKFTKLISNDEVIPFYGDGLTSRDYTFVEDIISGVLKSINFVESNSDVYEIFNLGESQTITLNTMVEGIEDALGKKAKLNKLPMQPGDVNCTYADISKAKEILGYNPTTKYKEGIVKFVNWYQEINN